MILLSYILKGATFLKNTDKKKRFKLFDLQREGKGISKNATQLEPGLKKFFISYKNSFNKLVSVNIIMVLGNFPLFFLIATLAGETKYDAFLPLTDVFQNLAGVFQANQTLTPFEMSIFALEGIQNNILVPSALTYAFYGISALTLLTFGLVNVGTAYVIRNLVMGEPVFVWTDFIYAVKRNWKQALPFGIIDVVISALLIFNIYTTFVNENFLSSFMFWSNIVIAILYFFIRYYVYVQMVTFKLSLFKIFKNSMIFALIGIKRNFLALLGIIIVLFFEILFLLGSSGILVPFAVAAPLVILFSSFAFMKVYASYYKIKEIMIDPYKESHPEEFKNENDEIEAIMRDDVTENERLQEIKRRNNIRD